MLQAKYDIQAFCMMPVHFKQSLFIYSFICNLFDDAVNSADCGMIGCLMKGCKRKWSLPTLSAMQAFAGGTEEKHGKPQSV
jgi:hypothetical protein